MNAFKKFDIEDFAFIGGLIIFLGSVFLFISLGQTASPISKITFWSVPIILLPHLCARKIDFVEINKITIFFVSSITMLTLGLLGIFEVHQTLIFLCFTTYVVWSLIYTLLLHIAADIISLLLLICTFLMLL